MAKLWLPRRLSSGSPQFGGPTARDLARACPACLSVRLFPEKFLFGQAEISMKNFQF